MKAISADDPEIAKLLKNNVSRLASAKTNYTIQLIDRCRADINGVMRSKEEFKKAAKVVINRANSTQAAEYNTAVHRSRVVKQFEQFQREKHLYPNFEWLRTRSSSPREVHLTYVGRIWSLDDPFLKNNHPGCTWNCKCDGRNTDKPVTDNRGLVIIPASAGLEGNPYETKEIFSDKHPYFSRVHKHIPELGVLYNPDDIVFIKEKDAGGKEFLEHYNCRRGEEREKNHRAVAELNKIGYGKEIRLLPQIHASQPKLRARYYGEAFQKMQPNDCPDAMIGGKLIEFKSANRKNASKRVLQASKKADIVYLELTEPLTDNDLSRFIKGQWADAERGNIHTLIITNNGATNVYTRPI